MKDISIIIPTYNRPNALQETLTSYCNQQDVFEIIIMDDFSDVDYTAVIKEYSKKFPGLIKYFRSNKHHNQAWQKNKGIDKASGNYILFGEDDVFLADNYCKVLKQKIIEYQKQNVNIFVSGSLFSDIPIRCSKGKIEKIKEQQQKTSKELFSYKAYFGLFYVKINNDTEIPFTHSLFMINTNELKKSDVKFYEKFKSNCFREDSDIQLQLWNHNLKCIITPETECYHLLGGLFFRQNKKMSIPKRVAWLYGSMRANTIFWKRNKNTVRKHFDYSYPIIVPIYLHDCRAIKAAIKNAIKYNKSKHKHK